MTGPDGDLVRQRPARSEPRGDFPVHGDCPRPPLTAAAAAARARARLEEWRRDHGD